MFLAFGGVVAMNADHTSAPGAAGKLAATGSLVTLLVFLGLMGLGVLSMCSESEEESTFEVKKWTKDKTTPRSAAVGFST